MKLVRVDHSKYINTDRINAVVEYNPNETHVFTGDSYEPFVLNQPIKKVLDAICGSEEHLVNDASMNILKAESINSGHLNQQKYPSR
ncbi:hypothetical protein [Pediococcus pentosaceus]|uniref:hypothetical protein n=1 Tax=Pediococcus pentosaceus TaxID=1255 RepID=UPI004036AEB8